MIDSHSHIYSEEFDADLDLVIQRSKDMGIEKIIMPNIDSTSLPRMLKTETEYPNFCYATIGLHPTSVKENYLQELEIVKSELERRKYIAIGEIGIDLYWDKTYINEQIIVFKKQIEWALEYNLPIIIHVRDSFRETMEVLSEFKNRGLKGVFHSFTGSIHEAKEIIEFGGFFMGINGIVTFKNSNIQDTVKEIGLKWIILETDAPYLTPIPFRGKRNESSYLSFICKYLSTNLSISTEIIAKKTTENCMALFFT